MGRRPRALRVFLRVAKLRAGAALSISIVSALMLPTPAPAVVFQRIDDGAVLYAASTEIYFGLNEVGAAIWELLPPASTSLDEVCDKLATRYPDAPRDELRSDVQALLAELLREGLVTLVAAPESRGESAT